MGKAKLEQNEQNEFNDWVSQLDNYYATVGTVAPFTLLNFV